MPAMREMSTREPTTLPAITPALSRFLAGGSGGEVDVDVVVVETVGAIRLRTIGFSVGSQVHTMLSMTTYLRMVDSARKQL